MSTAVIAFTGKGAILAARICAQLPKATAYAPRRYCTGPVRPMAGSLAEWTGQFFHSGNALIYIGAAGIAVRAIAPLVRGKDTDPAVLCIDEGGRYVIPLLSGHLGGANRLARELAERIGGVAVITTATDGRGMFSPDGWAAENGCAVADITEIKQIAAALLDGEPVGFRSEFPVSGPLPAGLVDSTDTRCGIEIALTSDRPFPHTLHLIPRCIVAGIGCRRGIAAETLERRLRAELAALHLPLAAVGAVASIDLKREEPGLIRLCEGLRAGFVTFSAAALMAVEGAFTPSRQVERITGADNVCERAAVLAGGTLLTKKTAADGVTVAIARREYTVRFRGAEE